MQVNALSCGAVHYFCSHQQEDTNCKLSGKFNGKFRKQLRTEIRKQKITAQANSIQSLNIFTIFFSQIPNPFICDCQQLLFTV